MFTVLTAHDTIKNSKGVFHPDILLNGCCAGVKVEGLCVDHPGGGVHKKCSGSVKWDLRRHDFFFPGHGDADKALPGSRCWGLWGVLLHGVEVSRELIETVL